MSEKYYGNYLGIVISPPSWDPERRNRVQVWIPSISNTIYNKWNDKSLDRVFFNFSSSDSPKNEIIERIRGALPWAECASPLIGGGSPFYTNPADSEKIDTDVAKTLISPSLAVEAAESVDQNNNEDVSLPQGQEPPVAPDLDIAPESPSEIPENSPSGISLGNAAAEASVQNGADNFEPPLSSFDEEGSPSPANTPVPSASPDGNALPPAQDQPQVPIINQDYTLQSGALPPNPKLLNDVISTVKQVYGPNAAIRISSGERSGSTRHGNGNAVDFFVQVRNPDGSLTGVKGDALAPLVQSWVAQGYAAGVGMTISENGRGNALHFDQTDSNIWAYTGEVRNGRNIDISYSPDKVSTAFASAIALGKEGNFPSGVDPATLASSTQFQNNESRPVQAVNYFAGANRGQIPGGYDGSATGTFSTVNEGAKVWVFFYGGDIQKPVYFAQSLDSASYAQANQNPQIT